MPALSNRAVLLLLFFGSGCAALIYEVVWLQLLQLVIGSSAVSMAILLGTFMGGMCFGSLLLPRLIPHGLLPLRVFALLELGTGFCGLAALAALPFIQRIYIADAEGGQAGMLVRGLTCAACLLLPTMLMGATLPVMSRVPEPSELGLFYGANIAGGVVGCLLAGFLLLPQFDMTMASTVAATLNGLVALLAWLAATATRPDDPAPEPVHTVAAPMPGMYLAIALSGFCALGAEVVWTRLLSLSLGPTVYTFSIILAVFLAGLGLGSAFASRLAGEPRRMLAICQALLPAAIAWSGYLVALRLPYWDKNLSVHANPWKGFVFDLACCALALLPAAVLWGASFPLALTAILRKGGEQSRVCGQVYAANTAGAIAGSVLFALVLVPRLGSQDAQRVLIVMSGIASLSALATRPRPRTWFVAAMALPVVAGFFVIPALPWQLIAFGRRLPMEIGPWKSLYAAEGMNSSIAYTEWVDKRRFFHVAGKIEASSTPADMRLQRMLGHIPALLHPSPQSVLIVGCGAGVTAGAFVVHPEVQRITLCEIEPRIPPASARFFGKENHSVVTDPRTRIVFDDARHFVLTAREKFDIITSDPIHPWVKGAATLYSKEYFEMCRAHLKPGGLVTQWVPLYDSDFATVKSEIATFFEVFPNAVIWGNVDDFDQGYDLVMMGSAGPALRINVDEAQGRLSGSARLATSLKEVGFASAAELLGTYASRGPELKVWLRGAQINSDRNLRLQYLAGMALNKSFASAIYGQIQQRSPFPESLFSGAPEAIAAVHQVFDAWRQPTF